MADPHTNFGYSTVATAPSPASSGTSLVVQAGDGAKFPSTGSFNATVWPASTQPTTANAEIVRVTAISTDTFTITRAQESSSARTIVVGDQIADTITAKTLTDVELNVYVTDQNKTIPATTQVIFETYLELSASFFYELSTDAILVIGDFATPLPPPDQYANVYATVADELIPATSQVTYDDYLELSAPFAEELSQDAILVLNSPPSAVAPNVLSGMPGNGMAKLFDATLSSNATNISTGPNAIPPGHGCLLILIYARSDRAANTADNIYVRFNNDSSSSDYTLQQLTAGNTAVSASANVAIAEILGTIPAASAASNVFGLVKVEVFNYDNTVGFKQCLSASANSQTVAANSSVEIDSGMFASTAAIYSVTCGPVAGTNLLSGSRMAIYGTQ